MKKVYSFLLVLLVSITLISCGDPAKVLIGELETPKFAYNDSEILDKSEIEDFFTRYTNIYKSQEESCLIKLDKKTTYTRDEAIEAHKSLCYNISYYSIEYFKENYITFANNLIDLLFNELEVVESSKEYVIDGEFPKNIKIEFGSDAIEITNYTAESQVYAITTLAIIKGEIYFSSQSIFGKQINDIKYYSNNYMEYQVLYQNILNLYKKDIKTGEFYFFTRNLENDANRYSFTRGNKEIINVFTYHDIYTSFSTRIYKDNQFVAGYFRLLDETEYNSRGGNLTVSIFKLPNWNKMVNETGNLYGLYDNDNPVYQTYFIHLTDPMFYDATQSNNFTFVTTNVFLDEDNSDVDIDPDLNLDLDKIYSEQSYFIENREELMTTLGIDYESLTFEQLVDRFPYYDEIVADYFS